MSASRYTAMRRTVATANVTKVHYPTNIALNYNPLYSTIGCNPTYSLFMYADPPCCKIPPPIPPLPPSICSDIYDGLFSQTIECIFVLDGNNSQSNNFESYNGGTSLTDCTRPVSQCVFYDGLFARDNNLPPLDGLNSQNNNLQTLNGLGAREICSLPVTCTVYDGEFSVSQISYNIDGGGSTDNNFYNYNAGNSVYNCSTGCLGCINYDAGSSLDNYLPSFNGETSSSIITVSLTGETSSYICSCFSRC